MCLIQFNALILEIMHQQRLCYINVFLIYHDVLFRNCTFCSNYCIFLIILKNNETCSESIHIWFQQNTKFETIPFINSQNRPFYTYVPSENSWRFDLELYAFSSHCILLIFLKKYQNLFSINLRLVPKEYAVWSNSRH